MNKVVQENLEDKFYKRIAKRVSDAIEKSGRSHFDIFPSDYKLISPIINNKRGKNNPYLLTPKVFGNEHEGLLSLSFHSKKEIIWGSEEEIDSYLYELFVYLITSLLRDENRRFNDLLYDYVPYAKYATLFEVLVPMNPKAARIYPAFFYGVREDDVFNNLEKAEEKAVKFLYQNCYFDFRRVFLDYTCKADNCREIVNTFKVEFINKRFIPMLEMHRPDEHSLGLRVRNLILADLSTVPELIEPNSKLINREAQKKLINASSTYIVRLEEVQRLLIESNTNP